MLQPPSPGLIPADAMCLDLKGEWDDICLFVTSFPIDSDTTIYADVTLEGANALPLRFSFRHSVSGEEYDHWAEYSVGRTTLLLQGYDLTARSKIEAGQFNEIRFGGQGSARLRLALAIVRRGVLEFGSA
jgi:hypothetical protein